MSKIHTVFCALCSSVVADRSELTTAPRLVDSVDSPPLLRGDGAR